MTSRFSQARVRLSEEGAQELYEALDAHTVWLLDVRRTVLDVPEAKSKLNARVDHSRRVMDELQRTAKEHGWSLGDQDEQLQQPD